MKICRKFFNLKKDLHVGGIYIVELQWQLEHWLLVYHSLLSP